jgi:hypothetical protein
MQDVSAGQPPWHALSQAQSPILSTSARPIYWPQHLLQLLLRSSVAQPPSCMTCGLQTTELGDISTLIFKMGQDCINKHTILNVYETFPARLLKLPYIYLL